MEDNHTIEKAVAPLKETTAHSKRVRYNNLNSSHSQRQRLLAALRTKPSSTIEIRKELDILGVAPRIYELRKRGHDIQTMWTYEETYDGAIHRVARYHLIKEV